MSEALVKKLRGNVGRLTEGNLKEAADRIKALEREVKELREHCEAMEVEHRQAIEAMQAAEADKARLSEALRKGRKVAVDVMKALMATGSRDNLLLADAVHKADDVARATLAGSGSGWRTTDRETEVLFFASYCGDDNPACSPARPCPVCLGMSNVYRIPAGTPIDYDRQLEPDWLINKHLEKLTARQIGKAPAAPQQGGE